MNRQLIKLACLVLCGSALAGGSAVVAAVPERSGEALEWNFRVYLDDSEIGYHNFRLTEDAGHQQLVTEASFRVKFLFVTAYRYEHSNRETWQGDCLLEIDSRTDANGKTTSVRGLQGPDGFLLDATGERTAVNGCVKTFAYWNPDFLNESALLNSQTGELTDISVERLDAEQLTVLGEQVEARRYRLQAKDIDLDLWYSEDRRWLGLQSTTKSGRKLRYELI